MPGGRIGGLLLGGAGQGVRSSLELLTYVWLPLLVFALLAVSLSRWPNGVLLAVALVDFEAALLGPGEELTLPFIVAVPLVGVALAARRVPANRLFALYFAAWAGSSTGIVLAVWRIVSRRLRCRRLSS